jgi:hypothetical protein
VTSYRDTAGATAWLLVCLAFSTAVLLGAVLGPGSYPKKNHDQIELMKQEIQQLRLDVKGLHDIHAREGVEP